MHAFVFKKQKLLYLTDYPLPRSRVHEALIKVTHAGICNTDLEIMKGYMGFQGVLGHEFVGIVEKCRQKDLIGKRVVGEINISCGTCLYCKRQLQNHCPGRSVLGILKRDGVFAEYVALPIKNIHVLPDSISDEEAVFVEPLSAAFEITCQTEIMPYHTVCVLGDGKLGLLVGQALSLTGCDIVVVGKHREKLSILRKRGIKTKLSSLFDTKGFDIVIDCTGSANGVHIALKIIKPRGRVIIKTTTAKRTLIDLTPVVVNELNLIGSRCGPFPQAIRALEKRKIDVLPLISRVFTLQNGIKAFQHARKKGVLKTIIKVS
jgi:threonine dehydrogenase-like Zn-dependent dehydrogenase